MPSSLCAIAICQGGISSYESIKLFAFAWIMAPSQFEHLVTSLFAEGKSFVAFFMSCAFAGA